MQAFFGVKAPGAPQGRPDTALLGRSHFQVRVGTQTRSTIVWPTNIATLTDGPLSGH